ncbi:dihydrodipicolinate synthetase family domain-containing protein [Phthorimaea operculella]|nr:dihydrodipicolinate synthetase family domain-containing protein [Phthorimaea operculella]
MGNFKILVFLMVVVLAVAYEVEEYEEGNLDDYEPHKEFSRYPVPRGIVPTVFTPLNHDGTVNLKPIHDYARFLKMNGVKGVLVGGTTGEHSSLDVHDRMRVIDEWVKVGKQTGLHIMGQVGAQPFDDVILLTKHCVKVGCDSIMTLPELYFKPRSVDELVFFVKQVAKAAPNLAVTYYHNPNYTDVTVSMPEFVTEASKQIPNFKGIKFSAPNLDEADATNRNLRHDQVLWLSPEQEFAPGAIIGIKDLITPILNIFPRLSHAILDAVAKSDLKKASFLQKKLTLATDAINAEVAAGTITNIPPMKAAMEIKPINAFSH